MRIRSRLEAKLLPLLTLHDVPIPECNVTLRLGSDKFEVDFLWRRQKLVVETDSSRFHDNPAARRRDSRRNRVFPKFGYLISRLGWEDLRDRPDAAMAELLALLVSRT